MLGFDVIDVYYKVDLAVQINRHMFTTAMALMSLIIISFYRQLMMFLCLDLQGNVLFTPALPFH